MAFSLLIAGIERASYLLSGPGRRTLVIRMGLGSDWFCDFPIFDETSPPASAYRPALRDVVIVDNGTRLFKGKIVSVKDEPIVGSNTGTITRVTAKAQSAITDQLLVTRTYATGQTLKQVVSDLTTTYLVPLGITLDPGMATGATMKEIIWDAKPLKEALNDLQALTGWLWRVIPTDVLEMFEPGTKVASYSLTAANRKAIGPVTWEKTLSKYVNKVILHAGTTSLVMKTASFVTDGLAHGGTTNYVADYPAPNDINGVWPNVLYFDGVAQGPIFWEGTGIGQEWHWLWSTHTLQHDDSFGLTPAGITISFVYNAQFPITATATDASHATDPWEAVYGNESIFDIDAAQAYANGLLRQGVVEPRQVACVTREGFVMPGDAITLTFADRVVSGSHLITSVSATDVTNSGTMEYALTCLSGTEAQANWTEQLRSKLASGGISGVSIASSGSGTTAQPVSLSDEPLLSAQIAARVAVRS